MATGYVWVICKAKVIHTRCVCHPILVDNDMHDYSTMSLSAKLGFLLINREPICSICKERITSASRNQIATIVPQSYARIEQHFRECIMIVIPNYRFTTNNIFKYREVI